MRWYGTLTLDDGSSGGIPTTGWFLDPDPPQRAPMGDISLACQLTCTAGTYAGNTIVRWNGPAAPNRLDCVSLLNSNPGQRTEDVPEGAMACFGTEAGRVGYFKPSGGSGGRQKLDVTVWELPS
ncbi:hypothetical protein AB0K51_33285 [Kitasatospora sp. NPDC049285]|uniref:hypothetical protein n=1 Tax=Kitasatospora sp. NPDC049285 TaxID=3157096 RepID=UPI003421917B